MGYKSQKIIAFFISIALAALILGLMFVRVWGDLHIAVGDIQYNYLIPALLFCTLSWLIRGYRYQKILNYLMIPAGLLFSTACVLLSQTINLIVPARLGDLVRVVPIHHDYQATVSQGLSSIIIERLFDVIIVAFFGLIAVVFIIDVPDWFVSVIAISLVVTGIGMLFILVSKEWKTTNKYLAFLLNMFTEIRAAALSRNAIMMLAATSTIIWIFEILVCYFVALMFQVIISFNLVLLAVVIGNLVKAVPITPGGIGTYEFALAATFELGKVPAATATIVSVVDHLIKNLITLIGGVASIAYFGTWVIPQIMGIVKEKLYQKETK
ncbi:MAG: flippase-like domain-containing protein [Methanomicrobiales archaeon]|jgi:uncharacterized protein (TIRG00374 family)|nr:flippase-like domain-containing protein [Methanomicrobiales archaeon]